MSFSLLCVIEYHFYNNKKQSRYNHEQCGGLQISIEHNNTLPFNLWSTIRLHKIFVDTYHSVP